MVQHREPVELHPWMVVAMLARPMAAWRLHALASLPELEPSGTPAVAEREGYPDCLQDSSFVRSLVAGIQLGPAGLVLRLVWLTSCRYSLIPYNVDYP